MNKKVVLIICAVLAFFAGGIFLDYFPAFGSLVALVELCVGGVLGYFWAKDKFESIAKFYENQYSDFMAEFISMQQKYDTLVKKTSSKVNPVKEKKVTTNKVS